MRQSTRIILNSTVTYGRMALTVGIGLVITRLLLRAMTLSDYGLLTAIGAVGALLPTLIDALSFSCQRHMAFEIGRSEASLGGAQPGDGSAADPEDPQGRLSEIFNTALGLFVALMAVVAAIGLMSAGPVVAGLLTVPADRQGAAWWVFQLTVLNVVVGLATVPYRGLLAARQQIVTLSVFDVLQRLSMLAAVLLLSYGRGDPLVSYAAYGLGGSALTHGALLAYCWASLPESRPDPRRFRRREVAELGGFAGWMLLGQIAGWATFQGGVLLLNVWFGPAVNGSYAVAMQAAAYLNQLAGAAVGAAQPAMTRFDGMGLAESSRSLALTLSKLGSFAMLVLFVPAVLEADAVLLLWLGQVPPHGAAFLRLTAGLSMVWVLSSGHVVRLGAVGEIGRLTVWSLPMQLVPLGVSALLFSAGYGPTWLPAANAATALLMAWAWVPWHFSAILGIPAAVWGRRVLAPVAGVAAGSTAMAWVGGIAGGGIADGEPLGHLAGAILGSALGWLVTVAWFGLSGEERDHLARIVGAARSLLPTGWPRWLGAAGPAR